MKDKVNARERTLDSCKVKQIRFNQPKTWITERLLQKLALASREIIDTDHMKTVGQEPVNKIAANKTGTASDEGEWLLHIYECLTRKIADFRSLG